MFMAIFLILLFILMFLLVVGIQALIYWGIGTFVCWAFSIPFTVTFWHGLAAALIISVLTGIFKREVIIKND